MSDTASQTAEPDVMAMAMAADNSTATEATPSPEQTETVQADAQARSDTTAHKAEEAPATEQKQDSTQQEPKAESAYKRAQRDQARLADNWKKFEAEKNQLRMERETIAREREEFRKQRDGSSKRDSAGAAPEDYEALAARYEAQGQDDYALAAREKARQLRAEMQTSAQQPTESWRTPEFQRNWQENVAKLVSEDPTLADPQNPICSTTNKLVNDPNYGRFFRAHPDGIKAATEVAKILHTAQTTTTQNKGLQQELTKARAEIQRLTKLTAIGGSHPTPGNMAQTNKAMPSEDEVMALAAQADASMKSW